MSVAAQRYAADGRLRIVDGTSLGGRVVVVAGNDASLGGIAAAVAGAGARVAVVSATLPRDDAVDIWFRADPADRDIWDRVAMHVEQHLGPVDGVVTEQAAADVVRSVFGTDLARRQRPDVVVVESTDSVGYTVTRLLRTPPATPPRSAGDVAHP